jgi:hypothetical protein
VAVVAVPSVAVLIPAPTQVEQVARQALVLVWWYTLVVPVVRAMTMLASLALMDIQVQVVEQAALAVRALLLLRLAA